MEWYVNVYSREIGKFGGILVRHIESGKIGRGSLGRERVATTASLANDLRGEVVLALVYYAIKIEIDIYLCISIHI